MDKHFTLTKPCGNCPFRKDGASIDLREGRREQIIEDLLTGASTGFKCHKTVHGVSDEKQCPGASAVARKFGRDTVMVQVATRMGEIPANHYDNAMESTLEPDDLRIDYAKVHISPK